MKKSILLSILMFAATVLLPAQTVAVFDFDCDDETYYDKVSTMTDLLVHELVKGGDVTVVERKKIDKVMAEYRFQANPYIDITTAKQMGKGIGADCIIVGSVAALGCPLYITARMIDVEKGTVLHSAKMSLNFWNEYESQLPKFASECVKKMPQPNIFTGVWTGTLSTDEFDDSYEITFGEKSKCGVKVVSVDSDGNENVLEGSGTYSYTSDSFSGGKIFKLNATFRNAKTKRLRKIEWAYPVSMNRTHTEFSINVYPDSTKKELARLTLSKVE